MVCLFDFLSLFPCFYPFYVARRQEAIFLVCHGKMLERWDVMIDSLPVLQLINVCSYLAFAIHPFVKEC